MWSTASFDAPYGFVGASAASSRMGTSAGSPYVAAVEEKTSRRTPDSRMAARSSMLPPTLLRQYLSGFCTDSPTWECAAKCSTPSYEGSSTSAASWMRPSTKPAPAGTASRNPVDRSSRTVTECPASRRCAVTTEPT
jgi:hypothetical protein